MKTTTDVLQTKLTADSKGYTEGITKAEKSLGGFTNKTKSGLANLKKHWLAYTAVIASAVAIGKKIVDLAAEQEQVEKRLAFAVKSAGLNTKTATEHLKKYAASLQQTSRYGDEAIIPIQTMLIQLGELSGEKLDRATKLTLDFASAMGIDIKAAGILMAKAATGSTESLSRYGIVLEKGIPEQEKFNVLLDTMAKKFGGTAKADLDTYAGAMAQFKNTLGDFAETIGMVLLPPLTKFLHVLSEIIRWGTKKVEPGTVFGMNIVGMAASASTGTAALERTAGTFGFGSKTPTVGGKGTKTSAPAGAFTPLAGGADLSGEQGLGSKSLLEAQRQLRESFDSEELQGKIAHAAELANIDADAQSISLEQMQFFEDNKTRIAQQGAKARVEAGRMGLQALATAFPKMKAFAVGEALVSTYQAITNALATKPFFPAGLAAAALAASQGFAAVKAIKSQGISGGGGTSTYSYAGASMSMPVGGQTKPPSVKVFIKGAGLENLIDQINTVVEQNDVELISTQSLTAGALA